jgi:hypothetical protein
MSKEAGAGAPKEEKEEIEITPEMIEAGIGELLDYDPEEISSYVVVRRLLKAALSVRR